MNDTGSAKRGVASLAVATVFAAVSGFLVTLLAARILQPAEYAEFATGWALLYLMVGMLNGIQQDTARTVAVGSSPHDSRTATTRIAIPAGWVTLLIIAALAVILFLVPGYASMADGSLWFLLSTGGFAGGQMLILGIFAGTGKLRQFAWLSSLEAASRVALFALAFVGVLPDDLFALVLYAMVPFAAWLLASPWTRWGKTAWSARTAVATPGQVGNFLLVGLAALLTSFLTTGIPALLTTVMGQEIDPNLLGTIILLVTLTRAPLLMPLTAFQSTIVGFLAKSGPRLRNIMVGTILVVLASFILALLAWACGPFLLDTLFGASYEATPLQFFWLTLVAGSLGVLFLVGAAVLATGHQAHYLILWAVATLCTLTAFILPGDAWARVVTGLGLGPLFGCVYGLIILIPERRKLGRTSVIS